MVQKIPVSASLILFSVIGFLLFYMNAPVNWLRLLTYSDFQVVGGKIFFIDSQGQYWRWITPIFLHFGWLHITFNSLWMWELGGLIEQRLGSPLLLFMVLVCGVGSNMAQHWYGGPSLFGGMSGVVYALLGFCWIYNLICPWGGLQLPRGIVIFMLIWLLFGMVGSTEALGFGSIANAAHLAGLILGSICGLVVGEYTRHYSG